MAELVRVGALMNPRQASFGDGESGLAGDAFLASNGATHPNFPGVVPPGLYDSGTDKTWFFWEAWATAPATDRREVRCSVYDHTLGLWLPETVVGTNTLSDDAHGSPAGVMMDDGHVYVFYGGHGTTGMRIARTATAGSHFGWVDLTTLGTALTYSKPHNIGGVMHIVARGQTTAGENYPLVHYNTTSITAGVPAWTARHTLIDLGADTRCYFHRCVEVSGKLHIIGHRANAADTLRQDLFYVVYDPAAATLDNFAGTATLDISVTPADRTWVETNARLFTSAGGEWTSPADFALDSNGFPQIVFGAGPEDNLSLRHMRWNGSAFTAPVVFASVPRGNFNVQAVILTGADAFEVWYVDDTDNATPGSSGKSMRRKKFDAAGTFQSEETMYSWDGVKRIGFPFAVKSPKASNVALLSFTEAIISDADSGAGGLKLYMHGTGGLLRRVRPANYSYTSAASSYFSRLAGTYSFDEKYYTDELFKLLVAIGLAKFDYVCDRGANAQVDIFQNLITNTFTAQGSLVGGATWLAGRHVTCDGINGYADTAFIPATHGAAYKAAAAHHGVVQLNASLSANAFFGTSDGTQRSYMTLGVAPDLNVRVNDNTATTGNVTNKVGHMIANRSGLTKRSSRNGTQIATASVANTGLPTTSFKIGQPLTGTFANCIVAFDHVGDDLTLTECSDLYFKGFRPILQLRGLV